MIVNAFSVNMLSIWHHSVDFTYLTQIQAQQAAVGRASAVGHQDTANLFAAVLGVPVPCQRTTVKAGSGLTLLLGQYIGTRLPEGCSTLPEGAAIQWWLITVQ